LAARCHGVNHPGATRVQPAMARVDAAARVYMLITDLDLV
jgi:hypothetical protein